MHADITVKRRCQHRSHRCCLEDPRIPRSMPPIPWRCAGEVGGWVAWVLFWKRVAYGCMIYIDITTKVTELHKLALHSWLWRAFCCLAAFWPWMVWHRPSKRSCSRTARYLPRHPPLQTSTVGGCLLFHIGFFQCFSYEFGPVSHIQNLFQQLLLDFWDPMIIEEHQTTKYNQMMYINLLCLGLKRVSNDSRSSCWRKGIGAQCLHSSLTLMFVLDFTSDDIT